MSSARDQQLQAARDLDRASTVMIDLGVKVIKRNPIKVGAYLIGILICLFFNGWTVSDAQRAEYYNIMDKIDHSRANNAAEDLYLATQRYRQSKGWFSCDATCSLNKQSMESYQRIYNAIRAEDEALLANAKSKLGVFSEAGVAETRDLFWLRFSQGKGFATRQSKWDALFMGMNAMGRDEKFTSYLLRLIINVLFNFTLGVCGEVIGFIYSLVGLVRSYQASILTGLVFFGFASLAAIAFALSWLIGLYVATAGTVYVGAKLIASNMRLEDGRARDEYRRRVR